jgi:AmiR/NasT family two-component response regulator
MAVGGDPGTAAAAGVGPFVDTRSLDGLDAAQLAELARVLVERNAQLQQALDSRVLIEQAKGVLAERFSVSPDEAFQLLRRGARNHRVGIHALALRVVENPETPAELSDLVSR